MLIILMLPMLYSCGLNGDSDKVEAKDETPTVVIGEENKIEMTSVEEAQTMSEVQSEEITEEKTNQSEQIERMDFVDVFGQHYQCDIIPEVEKCAYDKSLFVKEGDKMIYQGLDYDYRLGVDVSYHQGDIDWKKVRDAGFEFAFLRVAYRGYGQEGRLVPDSKFTEYAKQAKEAGLDIGVYFYAQAISEKEAKEEADFVLGLLNGMELDLPVVYDPESVLDAPARTDNIDGEQFTKNTIIFCNTIKDAGYDNMVYSNMLWEAFEFNFPQIASYPIWYADYESSPQTPYSFEVWQYSNKGKVPGISGAVDLNIQMIKK